MDALVIIGAVIWAMVVVTIVSVLFATAKWEDEKGRSKVRDVAVPSERDACYDRCITDSLWDPGKRAACMATCGL
jgi:hypothetical protein